MPDLTKRELELLRVLRKASEHLDYCGYGDSWERECAEAEGLQKLIETTLEKYNGIITDD